MMTLQLDKNTKVQKQINTLDFGTLNNQKGNKQKIVLERILILFKFLNF